MWRQLRLPGYAARTTTTTFNYARRGLSVAAQAVVPPLRPTTNHQTPRNRLPTAIQLFGGSEAERHNLATRLLRLKEWPKLQQESIGICILRDGLFHESSNTEASTINDQSVASSSKASAAASSAPLAEAFLKGNLLGSILTVFHVDAKEKRLLAKTHGTEVLKSWAKDTLRSHLASMGSVGATGWILEPVLLDLADPDSDEAREDDTVLAKALTHKVSLKTHILPGQLIPAKYYAQPGKLVLLVFPRRETRPSEGLHRVERLMLDYCRKNLICLQTYYLALDRAYSPDAAVRAAEATRFKRVVGALPKGSLVLSEEAALDVLVEWTEQQRGGVEKPTEGTAATPPPSPVALDVDMSTFYLALVNFFYGPPSDVLAGSQVLGHLGALDRILVTDDGHHPYEESTHGGAVASVQAAQRGQNVAASLQKLMDEKYGAGRSPHIVCGDLEKANLADYSLVCIHSGNHPIEIKLYKFRLDKCKEAGVAVSTPLQLKSWLRRPQNLARVLKVWPQSYKARLSEEEEEAAAEAKACPKTKKAQGTAAAQGPVGGAGPMVPPTTTPWEHGFRKAGSNECSDCESWSCRQCTHKQEQYAARCGKHHQMGLGMEWRDLY